VPLYEYKCLKCGRKTEKIENMNGPHLKKCPHCGGKVEAMFSAPAIQFKGSGWYVTDYGGKKSGSDSGKEEKAAESKDTKDAAAKDSAAKGSDSKESGSKDSKDSGSKEKKSDKSEKSDRSGKKK
jgi:putative FmdB family regulatory protein